MPIILLVYVTPRIKEFDKNYSLTPALALQLMRTIS